MLDNIMGSRFNKSVTWTTLETSIESIKMVSNKK